jgi:hypothetical protein
VPDGIIGAEPSGRSKKEHALLTSVQSVDAIDQEIMLKAADGSIETIMVTNPEYLNHIKTGDQVVITRAQALTLSVEKEG